MTFYFTKLQVEWSLTVPLYTTRSISLLVRILVKFRNPVQFGKVNIFFWEGNSKCQHHTMVVLYNFVLGHSSKIYVGFPVMVLIPSSSNKQFIWCVLQIKTRLLDALSAGTATNFSWISANSAPTSASSNIDSCRRDMVLLSTEIRLFTKDITDLTHSERVSTSTSSFLAQRCAYFSTESKMNLEFCFQVKDLGSLYLER